MWHSTASRYSRYNPPSRADMAPDSRLLALVWLLEMASHVSMAPSPSGPPIGPQLLVSVQNRAEAATALAGGADVVDIKQPANGPLGAAEPATIRDIANLVSGRTTVTAAAGELGEMDDPIAWGRIWSTLPICMVKVGLAGLGNHEAWPERFTVLRNQLPIEQQLVPVAYADHKSARSPSPPSVVEAAGQLGPRWVMVDTYDKAGPGLMSLMDGDELTRLVTEAHASGLSIALAGRLDEEGVATARDFGADLIGVRGAACVGGRRGIVSADAVRQLRHRLVVRETM